MTLPASGDISISDILTEFEMSGQLNLGHPTLRAYLNILSGDISFSDFYSLDVVWQYLNSGGPTYYYWLQSGTSASIKWEYGTLNVTATYYYDSGSYRYIRGPNVTGGYYKVARISI